MIFLRYQIDNGPLENLILNPLELTMLAGIKMLYEMILLVTLCTFHKNK